ncbi:hypothetical protein M2103_001200 [Ereboglobus sp. PH5-5]|uniref:hypothetical protein n=1 Tax=Ereboglobus sp. PH5-5 TaxID=2940529 RepID=UPI00240528AD|nr:hypothetical protein [Ereboglobus sp. PH5-5]MDF9832983.1 hypothetical protein [Ereboglobus sp. PH5-5]
MLPLSFFAPLLRGPMRMFFAVFLFVATIPFLRALDWLPITDEDREAVASTIDPSLDEDDVVIALPAGYKIEEGSSPKVVDRTKWGRYSIEIAHNRTKNTIIYNRIFEFLPVHMPAAKYSDVKRIFDFVHLQDSHTLTIRAGE